MIHRNLDLYNVAELVPAEDGNGLRLSRLPAALRQAVNPSAREVALHAAGCEIRLNLKPGASIRLLLQTDPTKFVWEKGGLLEVLHGPFQAAWHFIGQTPSEVIVTAPATRVALERIAKKARPAYDPNLTRLVLPYRPALRLLALDGEGWEPPRPEQVPARRLLIYGTSLTHGAWAVRPTETYAMQLARRLGVELINLGFGGSAWYEPEMADHIAARNDWDLAMLETHNLSGKVEPAEFKRRVTYFLRTIRAAHPAKPLFCVNLFMASDRFPGLLANGEQHRALGEAMRAAVEEADLPGVRFVPSSAVFRQAAGLSADLVHPAPAGMSEIAERLARLLRGRPRRI